MTQEDNKPVDSTPETPEDSHENKENQTRPKPEIIEGVVETQVDSSTPQDFSEETVIEDGATAEAGEANGGLDLQAEAIKDLEAAKTALEDRILRLQAEMTNMQKRFNRDRANDAKYRSQKLATDLIEVVDNLERALATPITSEDGMALKQGVEMVYNHFLQAFEKEGIQAIDPLGQVFDPNRHQAVTMTPSSDTYPSNTVANVLQKGYILEERILRPAMVIVAE